MPLIGSGTKLVQGPSDGFGGNRRGRRLPRISNVGQDSRYLIVVQLPAEKLGGSAQGGEPLNDQLRHIRRRSGERGRIGPRSAGPPLLPTSWRSAVRQLTDGALAERQKSCHHPMTIAMEVMSCAVLFFFL